MKFRRRANSVARDEVFLNLTSLIDVIFVLLLFFVVTTTFSRPTQLKIDLPEAASGTPVRCTISSGSSPASLAACSARTRQGNCGGVAPYPRLTTPTLRPRAWQWAIRLRIIGVLPVPPTVILPTTTTGTGAR